MDTSTNETGSTSSPQSFSPPPWTPQQTKQSPEVHLNHSPPSMDTSTNETEFRSSPQSFSKTINSLFYSGTGPLPSETAQQTSRSIQKMASYSCHISFLKACRDHDIIPRGLRLKNPLNDTKSKVTIHTASLSLIKKPTPTLSDSLLPAEVNTEQQHEQAKGNPQQRILR